jgi:hypothetical protein
MEITMKSYDITVTVKKDDEGVAVSEVFDMFLTCMLGITYQQSTLDDYIIELAEQLLQERKSDIPEIEKMAKDLSIFDDLASMFRPK